MLKRAARILVVFVVLLPVAALAQPPEGALAGNLPTQKTALYAEMDVGAILVEGQKALVFIDREAGQKVVYQVTNLYGLLRELSASYEFQPSLFDKIMDTKLYFVVMAKDEPEVKVHKYQVPRYDPETYERIPGEFEERTSTETKNYVFSMVLATPDEQTAANFMDEFKAYLDRENEKSPDSGDFDRVEIEVERGELIGDPEGEQTLGRLGQYIIISNGKPAELWAALMVPPQDTVSDTPAYGRFTGGDRKPQGLLMVNIQLLVKKAEDDLKRELEEAQKEYAAKEGGGEEQWSQESWRVLSAKNAYTAFRIYKELLSLDQCRQVGASFYFSATEDRAFRHFKGLLAHGENISPVLEELLSGSGAFTLPAIGKADTITIMARVSLKRIHDEAVNWLRASYPVEAAQFDAAMAAMKMQIGADVGEMLALLASDLYAFIDVVEKEREVREYVFDEETGEPKFVTEKKMATLPEVTLLCGLSDPQAAGQMLSTIFTTLAGDLQFNQMVKKRTYQETDVFCIGMEVTKPETYPDGLTSFAMTIVDRYLSFGSWEHVTTVIRRMKSETKEADKLLGEIVQKHADSNFLAVVPKAFQQKVQKLAAKARGMDEDPFDMLLEGLESWQPELEDEELGGKIKAALSELILAAKAMQEKSLALEPEAAVVSGTHEGAFYVIEQTTDMSK